MKRSIDLQVPTLAFALVLALGLAASAASAELASWDQARVTAIGQDVKVAVRGVEDALRKQPGATNIGSGNAQTLYKLEQDVRRASTEADQLAAALEDGKGREETENIFRGLMEKVRDVRDGAQRSFMPEPTLDAIIVAWDALHRIAPYYDPQALGDPVKDPRAGESAE